MTFGMKKKLEWCDYPIVKKIDDMFIRFDTTHEHDRQTDTQRQTDTAWRQRPRLCIASRGKKGLKRALLKCVISNDLEWPWMTCWNIQRLEASGGLSATAELPFGSYVQRPAMVIAWRLVIPFSTVMLKNMRPISCSETRNVTPKPISKLSNPRQRSSDQAHYWGLCLLEL